MRPFFIWLFLLFVGLSGMMFFYIASPQDLDNVSQLLPDSNSANILLIKIQKEVLAPPPLTGSLTNRAGALTVNGILQETNTHRSIEKADNLTLNKTLNKAAQAKVEDMFAKQYFEHVSPTGIGPADLAESVGYKYVRVGENLALGNFQDDADIVQAWMDSPGHRENIVSSGFSEIGIAVGQGKYEGHNTWLAVQTFGLPASACPEPDSISQRTFDQKKLALDTLSLELDNEKNTFDSTDTELDDLSAEISKLADAGNKKIDQGNTLVEQGNELMAEGDVEEATSLQAKGQKLQQEGEALVKQAVNKQEQQEQLIQKRNDQRSAYNIKITKFDELNGEISALVKTINQQIRVFNSCLEGPS